MPSDGRAIATSVACLIVAATGLAVVVLGVLYPERHLGVAGIACMIAGGIPLAVELHRRLGAKDRAAAHERFLTLEQAERQRTRDYCERELAWLEDRKREALQAVEDRRAEIEGKAVAKALHMMATGELDSGGVVRQFRRPADRNSAESFHPPASGGRN